MEEFLLPVIVANVAMTEGRLILVHVVVTETESTNFSVIATSDTTSVIYFYSTASFDT